MIRNKKTTSKLMSLLSALVAVVMLTTTVFASGVLSDIAKDDYRIEIIFGNRVIELVDKPFIENNDVYIPLRETLEKVGAMDNQKSEIIWDNGRIEIILENKSGNVFYVNENENTNVDEASFMHSYGIEIGKPMIIHNLEYPTLINFNNNELPFSNNNRDVSPMLKADKTFVPHYMLAQILSRFEPNCKLKYVVYDKKDNEVFNSSVLDTVVVTFGPKSAHIEQIEGEMTVVPNKQTTIFTQPYSNTSPSYTIKQFFSLFAQSDFENMKRYCTQECIDNYFHAENGDVFGLKRAELLSAETKQTNNTTSTDECVVFVDLKVEPSEYSSIYPSTDFGFFVHLLRQTDGTYLINNFSTSGM